MVVDQKVYNSKKRTCYSYCPMNLVSTVRGHWGTGIGAVLGAIPRYVAPLHALSCLFLRLRQLCQKS